MEYFHITACELAPQEAAANQGMEAAIREEASE